MLAASKASISASILLSRESGLSLNPLASHGYQDILRGLCHLHRLGITHSDLRPDNVLLDSQGRAILCDFSAPRPFGQPNPRYPDTNPQFPIHGMAEFVSDATDMFAMATLVFHMETGSRPHLSVAKDGTLVPPHICTGNSGLDSMIEKAWLGGFDSTTDMFHCSEALEKDGLQLDVQSAKPPPKASLRDRVRHWRADREAKHGTKTPPSRSMVFEANLTFFMMRSCWFARGISVESMGGSLLVGFE